MTAREQGILTLILVCLGAGWGLSQPLIKIAVEGPYEPIGMVFIQLLIGTIVLGLVQLIRRRHLPFSKGAFGVWIMIALVGTIFPNTASYEALKTIPAGIYSILIATIPMMSFPIALAFGNETFSFRRLIGLTLGLVGVGFIIIPDASLPERAMLAAVPLALFAPFCYALEGNLVARFGTAGLGPMQVMFGASAFGTVMVLPIALGADQLRLPVQPWTVADYAIIGASMIHAIVYSVYVWMVGRAGPLFAAQVSYLVTGFGVLWSMLILQERYSNWIWAAIAIMALGIALVQPRRRLATSSEERDTQAKPSA